MKAQTKLEVTGVDIGVETKAGTKLIGIVKRWRIEIIQSWLFK